MKFPITLANGAKFDTAEALRLYFQANLRAGTGQSSAWFCPICDREILDPRIPCAGPH